MSPLSKRFFLFLASLTFFSISQAAEQQINLTFFTQKPGSRTRNDMTISIDVSIPPQGISGSDLLAKVENKMKIGPELKDTNFKINYLMIGGESIAPNTPSSSKLYPYDFFNPNKNNTLSYSQIITPSPTLAVLPVSVEYQLTFMIDSPTLGSALIEAIVKEFPRYNINIVAKENYEYYYIKKRSTTPYSIKPTDTYDINDIDRITFQLKKQ